MQVRLREQRARWLHPVALLLVCAPAAGLALRFLQDEIGPDPIEELTHVTGEWGLRFVLLSLAITPLRRFFGLSVLAPLRRTFGLAGFAYAALHFSTWATLDLGLDLPAIAADILERPFVTAGMAAFTILAALAATSTRAAMKRLGKRWITLHRAVYAAAALAVLHHFWLIKADYRPALVHAAILTALFAARLADRLRRGRVRGPVAGAQPTG
jgi:methionine sulfoxide reductase heme-binding subunit